MVLIKMLNLIKSPKPRQIFIMIHRSSFQIEWLVYLFYALILYFNILHELGGGNVKKGLGTSKHLWVNAAKLIP
jgi:hypothetical protein